MKGLLKYAVLLNVLLFSTLSLHAQEAGPHMGRPAVQYGVEWGWAASVFSRIHASYYAEEGYIVDDRYSKGSFHSNGTLRGFVGCNIGKRWNITSGIAVQGLGEDTRAYVVSTYASYFLGAGDFVYLGLGAGSEFEEPHEKVSLSTLGYGHRYRLTRSLAIDTKINIQGAYVHPDIYDEGSLVPESRTRKNDAFIVSIGLSLALVF